MVGHAIRYFIGQAIARGATHLYAVAIAGLLSGADFVDFTFFLITANIYSRLANYSLNMVMAKYRFVSKDAAASGDAQDRLFRFATSFGLGLTVLLTAANSAFGLSAVFSVAVWKLNLALTSGYLLSIENNLIEIYQSHFQSRKYLFYMLSFTVALAILSAIAYWQTAIEGSTISMIMALMLAYVISQGVVLIGARAIKFGWAFSRDELGQFILVATPVCLYGLSSYASRYLEMIVLKSQVSIDSLAAFTFVFRLMEALNLVILAIGAVITPLLFGCLQSGEIASDSFVKIRRLLIVQIGFFVMYSTTIGPAVRLYAPRFAEAIQFIPMLFATLCLTLFVTVAQSFIIFYDRYIYMLIASCLGLSLGIATSYLLVPSIGIRGALFGKLTALTITLIAYIWGVRLKPMSIRQMPWRVVGGLSGIGFFLVFGIYLAVVR